MGGFDRSPINSWDGDPLDDAKGCGAALAVTVLLAVLVYIVWRLLLG
jgi:hypothetical protein